MNNTTENNTISLFTYCKTTIFIFIFISNERPAFRQALATVREKRPHFYRVLRFCLIFFVVVWVCVKFSKLIILNATRFISFMREKYVIQVIHAECTLYIEKFRLTGKVIRNFVFYVGLGMERWDNINTTVFYVK